MAKCQKGGTWVLEVDLGVKVGRLLQLRFLCLRENERLYVLSLGGQTIAFLLLNWFLRNGVCYVFTQRLLLRQIVPAFPLRHEKQVSMLLQDRL